MPATSVWSDPLDHILALDPGARGIAAFFTPGAALAAARALRRARRVLIVTGFAFAEDEPETDGPPGAAVLGRALRRLGAAVAYVTDGVSAPPVRAALKTLGEPTEIQIYPHDPDAARVVLERTRPTHLIAVERPGRARSGDYLSARGASIAAWNRPLDELFLRGRETGSHRGRPASAAARLRSSTRPVTIAVGDGGNEIGMGNVHGRLARGGRLMARIASVVRADRLVVAGTSNWGAYGVVAALARLSGEPLLHTAALERRLVQACVAAGAIDGITRRREPTVDGLDLDVHAAVVELLVLCQTVAPPSR